MSAPTIQNTVYNPGQAVSATQLNTNHNQYANAINAHNHDCGTGEADPTNGYGHSIPSFGPSSILYDGGISGGVTVGAHGPGHGGTDWFTSWDGKAAVPADANHTTVDPTTGLVKSQNPLTTPGWLTAAHGVHQEIALVRGALANLKGTDWWANVGSLATLSGTQQTGALNVTGAVIGDHFTSTVVTGTAPLTVASSTLVPNLNAALLNGLPAASNANAYGGSGAPGSFLPLNLNARFYPDSIDNNANPVPTSFNGSPATARDDSDNVRYLLDLTLKAAGQASGYTGGTAPGTLLTGFQVNGSSLSGSVPNISAGTGITVSGSGSTATVNNTGQLSSTWTGSKLTGDLTFVTGPGIAASLSGNQITLTGTQTAAASGDVVTASETLVTSSFVVSGGNVTGHGGAALPLAYTSGVDVNGSLIAYINSGPGGSRQTAATTTLTNASSPALTGSADNYIDFTGSAFTIHTATINGPAPSPASNAVRLAKVTVTGTQITSITDLRQYRKDVGTPAVADIRNYGAQSGQDSTQAIANAITALGTSGGTIYIPPGTFYLNPNASGINAPTTATTWAGDGTGTSGTSQAGAYLYETTYVTAGGETYPGPVSPFPSLASAANQTIPLSTVPLDPSGGTGSAGVCTARKLYRSLAPSNSINIAGGTNSTLTLSSTSWQAFKFTSGNTTPIAQVILALKASAPLTAGNMTVALYADDGGSPSKPTGVAVATAGVQAATQLSSGGYRNVTFSFASPFTPVASTAYWIVLSCPNLAGGSVIVNTQAGTNLSATSTNSGSTWTNGNLQPVYAVTAAYGAYAHSFTQNDNSLQNINDNGSGSGLAPPGQQGYAITCPYSNVTFQGVSGQSVLKVLPNNGSFYSLVQINGSSAVGDHSGNVSNVAFRDVLFDWNTSNNPLALANNTTPGILLSVNSGGGGTTSNVRVAGCTFNCSGVWGVIGQGIVGMSVVDSFFNFTNVGTTSYDFSLAYIEGTGTVVANNRFYQASIVPQNTIGGAAIETHGGPVTITGNVGINFLVGVNSVGSTWSGIPYAPTHGPVVIANNAFIGSNQAIQVGGTNPRTDVGYMSGVTIIGNVCDIDQVTRNAGQNGYVQAYGGIAVLDSNGSASGAVTATYPVIAGTNTFNNILIANNIVRFKETAATGAASVAATNAGISIVNAGHVNNLSVINNSIDFAPQIGIYVAPTGAGNPVWQDVVIRDNKARNAGNNVTGATGSSNGLFIGGTSGSVFRNCSWTNNKVLDTYTGQIATATYGGTDFTFAGGTGTQSVAFQFSGATSVSTVTIPMKVTNTVSADNITCTLMADAAGVPSGTALYTATLPLDASPLTTSYVNKTFSFTGTALTAGNTYWVVLSAASAFTGGTVQLNSTTNANTTGRSAASTSSTGASGWTAGNSQIIFTIGNTKTIYLSSVAGFYAGGNIAIGAGAGSPGEKNTIAAVFPVGGAAPADNSMTLVNFITRPYGSNVPVTQVATRLQRAYNISQTGVMYYDTTYSGNYAWATAGQYATTTTTGTNSSASTTLNVTSTNGMAQGGVLVIGTGASTTGEINYIASTPAAGATSITLVNGLANTYGAGTTVTQSTGLFTYTDVLASQLNQQGYNPATGKLTAGVGGLTVTAGQFFGDVLVGQGLSGFGRIATGGASASGGVGDVMVSRSNGVSGFLYLGNVTTKGISGDGTTLTMLGLRPASTAAAVTGAAGAQAGSGSPPAPVVTNCNDARGNVTFGTGTSPTAGAMVTITFSAAWNAPVPTICITETNVDTKTLNLYISARSSTSFTVSCTGTPAGGQLNTKYSFSYQAIG